MRHLITIACLVVEIGIAAIAVWKHVPALGVVAAVGIIVIGGRLIALR